MRASEWQYLCAVHDPPKACCAIDYCCHTLDWAANVLTSQKHFPSRLTLGTEASGGTQQSVRQLTNIFRRVYRIFAHAWFQHRQVFWQVEGNEGLYILFKKVCDVYNLIQEDNYTISPEAEGISLKKEEVLDNGMAILKNQADQEETKHGDEDTTKTSTGATTRRHKHTPSTGSLVPTIAEGDEDDNHYQSPPKTEKTKDLPIKETSSSVLANPLRMDRAETEPQALPVGPTPGPDVEVEVSKAIQEEETPKDEPALEQTTEELAVRKSEHEPELSTLDKILAASKDTVADSGMEQKEVEEAKTGEQS